MPRPSKGYVAQVGLDYQSTEGKAVRVEAGEEVLGLSKSAIENEIAAGNIIEMAENGSAGDEK